MVTAADSVVLTQLTLLGPVSRDNLNNDHHFRSVQHFGRIFYDFQFSGIKYNLRKIWARLCSVWVAVLMPFHNPTRNSEPRYLFYSYNRLNSNKWAFVYSICYYYNLSMVSQQVLNKLTSKLTSVFFLVFTFFPCSTSKCPKMTKSFYAHLSYIHSVSISKTLFIYLFICLFVYLFICLFIYLLIYLFIYLFIFD